MRPQPRDRKDRKMATVDVQDWFACGQNVSQIVGMLATRCIGSNAADLQCGSECGRGVLEITEPGYTSAVERRHLLALRIFRQRLEAG